MKDAKIKNILSLWGPFVGSAVILTVIQPPPGWAVLAWVSYVPFIVVCSPSVRVKPLALAAYVVSVVYWLGNLYWMAFVTLPGWSSFCLYTGLLWPMMAVCFRYCRIKKIPLFLAVPILVVGAERLQGLFLGGFFWRFLAHSQYANITLIQIADIFGAAGLSFVIAMVNGFVAELIIAVRERSSIFTVANLVKAAVVSAVVVAAIAYGRFRIKESGEFVKPGPLVGCVQSNVPQSVKVSFQSEAAIFSDLLEQSKECVKTGAELIVWPETMVQAILEPGVLRLVDPSSYYRTFDRAIREHSRDGAFLLVGAYGGEAELTDDFEIRMAMRLNSAYLYQPDGQHATEQYSKIHLVPFGEVMPFKKSIPWLHNLLMKLTPYDFDYSLDPGEEYTIFEITSKQGTEAMAHRFSVMICYEDAVPAIARRFGTGPQGQKRLDWLVNISNDGWFVRFKKQEVIASTELGQHAAICVFRAVENRLAVVRSVNTGISCLIDTVGRIKNGFLAGTLPKKAMERKGMAGWFTDRVPIDERTTFFSKYGQWLDFCCALCFISVIILPPLAGFVKTRKNTALFSGKVNEKSGKKR